MNELLFVSSAVSTEYVDGLVQDCSKSIANALELLRSCTKASIYTGMNSSNLCQNEVFGCFTVQFK